MLLIGYDPYVPADRFTRLGVEPVSYEDLLRDIVTFHVPSTDETRAMLREETFPLLKRGAIVINAARGDVVDEQALAEALDAGSVAAAGVDVFPHEPVTSLATLGSTECRPDAAHRRQQHGSAGSSRRSDFPHDHRCAPR